MCSRSTLRRKTPRRHGRRQRVASCLPNSSTLKVSTLSAYTRASRCDHVFRCERCVSELRLPEVTDKMESRCGSGRTFATVSQRPLSNEEARADEWWICTFSLLRRGRRPVFLVNANGALGTASTTRGKTSSLVNALVNDRVGFACPRHV